MAASATRTSSSWWSTTRTTRAEHNLFLYSPPDDAT